MPNPDEIKGRIKEAAGDLTGNEDLQLEGKADQVAGRAKELLDDAKAKAGDVIDAIKEKVRR